MCVYVMTNMNFNDFAHCLADERDKRKYDSYYSVNLKLQNIIYTLYFYHSEALGWVYQGVAVDTLGYLNYNKLGITTPDYLYEFIHTLHSQLSSQLKVV